jgi:hypothetical protein
METAALVAVALVAAASLVQAGALLVMLRAGTRAAQRAEALSTAFTRGGGGGALGHLEAASRDLAEAARVARRAVGRGVDASARARTNGVAAASTFRRNVARAAPLVAVVALIGAWRRRT